MGIYYYAVDENRKEYFSAPRGHSIKNPEIYNPNNPFPNMLLMMNFNGCNFEIVDDTSNDIPPSDDYKDITEDTYKKYMSIFNEKEKMDFMEEMNFLQAMNAYSAGKKVRCVNWVDCLYIQIDDWKVNEITETDATCKWELYDDPKNHECVRCVWKNDVTTPVKDSQLIENIRFLIKEWEKGC